MADAPLSSISGLASGLDTTSLIANLVAIRRNPIVRIDQQALVLDKRRSGLQEVSNLLSSMKTAAANLKDASLWAPAQTITSSNEAVLKVTGANAAAGGYTFEAVSLARAEQWQSDGALTAATTSGTLTVQVGSGAAINYSIAAGDDLAAVAKKINDDAGSGSVASVVNGRLYLSGKQTGAVNQITISGDAAAQFGFTEKQSAQDLSYKIDNGAVQTSASNTVTGALPGLTLEARAVGTAGVVVSEGAEDVNKVADRMQAFVDAYNNTLKGTRERAQEKPVNNPTTNAQRVQGSLFGNSTLRSVESELRDWVFHSQSGAPTAVDTLAELGISGAAVGSKDTSGQLTFNRATFIAAYQANPQGVRDALDKTTADASTEGLAQWAERRLDSLIGSSGVVTAALTGVDDQKKVSSDRRARLEERVTRYESQLRAQFARLETSLASLQSQGGYLSGQIAALR